MCIACKGRPWNDLYCVGWPYVLTYTYTYVELENMQWYTVIYLLSQYFTFHSVSQNKLAWVTFFKTYFILQSVCFLLHRLSQTEYPNMKIVISRKCTNIFVLSFALLRLTLSYCCHMPVMLLQARLSSINVMVCELFYFQVFLGKCFFSFVSQPVCWVICWCTCKILFTASVSHFVEMMT